MYIVTLLSLSFFLSLSPLLSLSLALYPSLFFEVINVYLLYHFIYIYIYICIYLYDLHAFALSLLCVTRRQPKLTFLFCGSLYRFLRMQDNRNTYLSRLTSEK